MHILQKQKVLLLLVAERPLRQRTSELSNGGIYPALQDEQKVDDMSRECQTTWLKHAKTMAEKNSDTNRETRDIYRIIKTSRKNSDTNRETRDIYRIIKKTPL